MKQIVKSFVMAMAVTASLPVYAAAPSGYYSSCENKGGKSLLTALHSTIGAHTTVSYKGLLDLYKTSDVYPDGKIWDMYSTKHWQTGETCGNYKVVGDCYNREHSFPKSWWGGSTGVPAYVDLNHLYPAEAAANQAKSNYPLGVVDPSNKAKFDNGISTVGYPVTGQGGGCQWVFEPDDEYKGDFARTYFYMVTCYQDLTWAPKYSYMMSQNLYPTLQGWAAKMLLEWSRQDPVSDKEKMRNDKVYTIQNNRNPFIDRPELAEYLWGNKAGEIYRGSGSEEPVGKPDLITPTQGMAVDFGQVALGRSTTAELFFRGENLTGSLDLVISGADRKMFSIPSSSLSTSLVNSPDGTWLTITYTPTALGTHNARIIISEGGMLGGSRGVALKAECLEAPVLTACTATEATDITSDSYRANWISPADEVVDYWIINRTKFVNGTATSEEILAEEPGHIIEGFGDSDSESYSVQSFRLGYRSPASNVVFVDHSGVTGIEAQQGLVVQGFEGCLRFICSAPQTGACIYDVSGKMVAFLATIHNNMDVELPAGIYFVTTDQCGTPVKVAVR